MSTPLMLWQHPLGSCAEGVSAVFLDATPEGRGALDDMTPDRREPDGACSTPEQFAQTVSPLLDVMVATARRVLGDEGAAWDAVQEALISLWRECEMPPNPRAWLLRAVTLRSLHLARTRARRWRHEGRARRERPEASIRYEPSQHLEYEEISGAMAQALSEIPSEFRDVLNLKTVAQMDYATIAETLQIPLGTVRSRLNRSRLAVRQILERLMSQEGSGCPRRDHAKG